MMKAAFIGLGVMGYPMAGHLHKKGFPVTVYNRTPSKAQQWVQEYQGASAPVPRESVAGADAVFMCLGNDNDIRSVVYGENGVLAGLKPGAVLTDHTTASAEIARELAAACQHQNCEFLDAPVSGGQIGAQNGQLTIMAGGTPDGYALVSPLFDCYAKKHLLMGVHGHGQLTKMVNQICISGILQGLSEGLLLAMKSGIDAQKSCGGYFQRCGAVLQMDNRALTMIDDKFDFGFALDWMIKDLSICLNTAQELGIELPLTERTKADYETLSAQGKGRMDTSSLLTLLKSRDIQTVPADLPIEPEIQATVAAGQTGDLKLQPGKAIKIMTGAPLPEDADIIIPVENCRTENGRVIVETVRENLFLHTHIARKGEDRRAGEMMLDAGTEITPPVAAAIASVGKKTVETYVKPTVSIIATGSEIISYDQTPSAWQIRDCNSLSCLLLCRMLGVNAQLQGIIPDNPQATEQAVKIGLQSDILIISGGVSAGDYDYVPSVLDRYGVRKIYHGIRLKPGKPGYFGKTPDGTAVFALPGNPVSVQTGFKLFVEPYIRQFSGLLPETPQVYTLDKSVHKKGQFEYYFPVKITDRVRRLCTAIELNSSGDFSAFGLCNGIAGMDNDIQQLSAGASVAVHLFRII
ncbi:hypothetical protein CHS0354_026790 [Potamilus streckersoni]|uniref:MoaB/Mog domain-containing protein n=1 Tax=Potamilus streckersoni TaxID=2493646 RepID=A0AAE0T611_9BIVA|nr:hypothetical protein CHS0354_026790 [Potamilus streckersoni]